MIPKRLLATAALGTLALSLSGPLPAPGQSSRPPNLILIVTDDQGYGDMGVQPRTMEIETPNMDRIANEGIRLTDAYANTPICGPSRAAIMTGEYNQRLGFYDNWESQVGLLPGQKVAPHYLKPLGYRTAIIGKWHLGWQPHNQPPAMGFDYNYGFSAGQHDYFDPDNGHTWEGGSHDINHMWLNGERVDELGYMTDDITDHALKFLEETGDDPYFLYIAYTTPHGPHQVPEDRLAVYAGREDMDTGRKVVRAMYDSLDDNIGRILEYLDETGQAEDTFIIFTGDNGGLAGVCDNHVFRGSKGYLSEGGIRIPFVARWPGRIDPGSVYTEPIIHMDILPTFLAAARAEIPASMTGVNLLPHWSGELEEPPHEALHWRMHPVADNRWATRMGDWKLVQARNVEGLFNLKDDPGEENDLSETHPEIVDRLHRLHQEWHAGNAPSLASGERRRLHFTEVLFRHELRGPSVRSSEVLKRLEREMNP